MLEFTFVRGLQPSLILVPEILGVLLSSGRTQGSRRILGDFTETIVHRLTQIAVVSSGHDCTRKEKDFVHFPGIYTRITHYLHWIQENAPGAQSSDCDSSSY